MSAPVAGRSGPYVTAKELRSIELVREIVGWRRLDAWPFAVLLAMVAVKAVINANQFEW